MLLKDQCPSFPVHVQLHLNPVFTCMQMYFCKCLLPLCLIFTLFSFLFTLTAEVWCVHSLHQQLSAHALFSNCALPPGKDKLCLAARWAKSHKLTLLCHRDIHELNSKGMCTDLQGCSLTSLFTQLFFQFFDVLPVWKQNSRVWLQFSFVNVDLL